MDGRRDKPESVPPPSLDALPAHDRCGKYELLGRLGMGGMAEIFLARERLAGGTARYLVVKRILSHVADEEAFVSMFLDEARLAARLRHPHICAVYDLGHEEDDWYLAMEWVHGVTLRELLGRLGRMGTHMPVAMAIRIASHVAGALHYAHRLTDERGRPLGIVHRDVSPHNVMVGFEGAVKLLDFGIAKAQSHSTRTRTGQLKGKLGYMAPEQCMQLDVDARTDVFALGILLYECLTGKTLFKADTEIATMRKILDHREAPSIRPIRPDTPASLDEVVRRALSPKPRERFQSAGEMQRALEQVLVSRGEVVQDTQLADWLGHLFAKEIARGPRLKKSRSRRRAGSGSGREVPSMSGVLSSSYGTASQRMDETELAMIARAADEEAAALARRHVWKLALVGLVFVALVGAAFWLVADAALLAPGPAEPPPETAAEPSPAPPEQPAASESAAPGPRFNVVLPDDEPATGDGASSTP